MERKQFTFILLFIIAGVVLSGGCASAYRMAYGVPEFKSMGSRIPSGASIIVLPPVNETPVKFLAMLFQEQLVNGIKKNRKGFRVTNAYQMFGSDKNTAALYDRCIDELRADKFKNIDKDSCVAVYNKTGGDVIILPVIKNLNLHLDVKISRGSFYIKVKSITRVYYLDAKIYAYSRNTGDIIFKTDGSVAAINDLEDSITRLADQIAENL